MVERFYEVEFDDTKTDAGLNLRLPGREAGASSDPKKPSTRLCPELAQYCAPCGDMACYLEIGSASKRLKSLEVAEKIW
jgi:hypothetical protein